MSNIQDQLKEADVAKQRLKEQIAARKEQARLKKEEETRALAEQRRLEAEALAAKVSSFIAPPHSYS